MKKLNKYLTVCLVLFLCSLELIGQGIIRGKLIEDESALEIIGGTILVAETGQGAVTDIDGSFSILSLTEGTYTIICSYLGFQELKITDVEVKGSDVTFLGEIRMIEEGVELSEVVVTAKQTRNNENAMQTLQRKSVNTVDAISSQAFSLRGDSDAASAMQRVTGVSVQNGKYVYVRGLSDRYSKTLLNGASIPGLDPDKNTVQMDLFHTNLIDNIVVFKNFTPDLPGDFSGGVGRHYNKRFS